MPQEILIHIVIDAEIAADDQGAVQNAALAALAEAGHTVTRAAIEVRPSSEAPAPAEAPAEVAAAPEPPALPETAGEAPQGEPQAPAAPTESPAP